MREIKFRAWNSADKRMIYQDQENFSVRLRRTKAGNEIYIDRPQFVDNFFVPDMGALMQFTGLKDKNGREIYEGDVIESKTTEIKYTVSWMEKDGRFWASAKSSYMPCAQWQYHEVIGNIHENPELLK